MQHLVLSYSPDLLHHFFQCTVSPSFPDIKSPCFASISCYFTLCSHAQQEIILAIFFLTSHAPQTLGHPFFSPLDSPNWLSARSGPELKCNDYKWAPAAMATALETKLRLDWRLMSLPTYDFKRKCEQPQ